jgi:myo-inositol-1(or 4)-monophosphatase
MADGVDPRVVAQVREIVALAGAKIEETRRSGELGATTKHDDTLVTAADRAADEFLRSELQRLIPCGWLSEETADDEARLSADRVWVVDPLDGTKEFVEGVPEYSVAVALVESGRPIMGVVHNPVTGDMFWAARGGGAFRNGLPIHVSEGNTLLASRSETRRGEFRPFEQDWELRATGSIELKLALIAAGEAAVTLSRGPKHEWDVCAGALIVEEAGGLATDLFGEALVFNQPFPKVRGILAGATEAHARALGQVRVIGASDRMAELANVRARRPQR